MSEVKFYENGKSRLYFEECWTNKNGIRLADILALLFPRIPVVYIGLLHLELEFSALESWNENPC